MPDDRISVTSPAAPNAFGGLDYLETCARQLAETAEAVAADSWADLRVCEDLTAPLLACLPSCRTFVDVGAERGFYTLLARRHLPVDGRVVAVEADPVRAQLLAERFAGDTSVRVVHAAAVAGDGPVELAKPADASARLGGEPACTVPGLRLDEILAEETVDLLKIDVEGAEALALAGLEQTLVRHRPVVFLEFHPWVDEIAPGGADDIAARLERLDYQITRLFDDGPRIVTRPGGRMILSPRERAAR